VNLGWKGVESDALLVPLVLRMCLNVENCYLQTIHDSRISLTLLFNLNLVVVF